jgi:ABC-type sugar transport system substrate-binding protein
MALTGCERTPTSASGARIGSGEVQVFLIGPGGHCPQWPAIVGGAQRYAQQLPYMRLEAVRLGGGAATQSSATLADILGKEPFAICLYVTDPAAVRPMAEQIVADGPMLITMGAPIDGIAVFAHVDPAVANGAGLLGENLIKVAAGRQSYLLLHDNGKDAIATRCYRRFMAAAGDRYTLRLLEQQRVADSGASPQQVLAQMVKRFHRVGLVVTLSPEVWLTVAPEAVLKDQTRFATLGACPELWPHLRSGRALALVGPLDGEIGYAAMEMVSAAFTKSREFGTQRFILPELVTPETLDDFARRYAEAAGLELADLMPTSDGVPPTTRPGGG